MERHGGGERILGIDRTTVQTAVVSESRGDGRDIDYASAVSGPHERVEGVARTYLLMSVGPCHREGDQIWLVHIVEILQGHKWCEESLVLLLAIVEDRKLIEMRRSLQHHLL